jgi:hypothetical protein
MNTRRNPKGTMTVMRLLNAIARLALQYWGIIITADRTVDQGVEDAEDCSSSAKLRIITVRFIRFVGNG